MLILSGSQLARQRKPVIWLCLMIVGLLAAPTVPADESNPFGFVESTESDSVVTIAPAFSVTSAAPGGTYSAALVVTISDGWHINSSAPLDSTLIRAELLADTVPGLTPHGISYPRPGSVQLFGQAMSVYGGRTVIRFQVSVANETAFGTYALPLHFTCQPCNNQSCIPPRTLHAELTVTVGAEGEKANPELFAAATSGPSEGPGADGPQSDLQRLIDTYGFWGYILALGVAFFMGLLLSFSPCTYPMIPITVSIFAGQDRSVGKGFVLSLFYVGSMAVIYGILGLVVSLVGGVFGAWLANPVVVITIAVVFVIFALSMFGLYELQVPSALRQKLGTAKGGGGVLGAIVLGIVAALVVSPCVGPFVAGILLYVATSGSPVIGFLMLFVFALGLGTLFVIIGPFASAIKALPRSGEWMESVKKFFGFVLILMAVFFMRTILAPTVTALTVAIILLVFAVFGGGLDRLTVETAFFGRLKKFLGVVAMLLGAYLLLGSLLIQGFILPPASEWLPSAGGVSAVEKAELIPWETELSPALARARAEGRPVIIDTWATWCANCKVLDKRTFGDLRVAAEAQRFVPVRLQLETADSPVTTDFKSRFGLKQYSLPTVLLLDPEGNVRKMIQGVIGPEDMIAEMQKL
jgi:thioredoxin:protein disulfide reductase